MSTCPPTNQLSDLILGVLPAEAADALTDHIGTCATCQHTMQTIATGEIPIEGLAAESASAKPARDSAYWKVVDDLTTNLRATQMLNTNGAISHSTSVTPDAGDLSSDELSFLSPSDDPAYIGRLQHFEVARVIGRGGMGVVLEAFDTHLHRRVAIKVLNPKFQQDEIARQRFCREGRAAAAIAHEHVVPMYQVARLDEEEIAFLVMQLIEGETLEDRLKKTSPLPPKEVARIAMQMAAGLSAAHAGGMVHRDIKPGNVLIEKETERVKLTDFGLARVAEEVKLTQTGMLTGTVLYMSPEQALGNKTDERSDLFSLGAVMYEMATGKAPFEAPTAVGVMKRIMDESPLAPHKIDSNVTKPLSDLIMKLISKKPDHRPDSATEVTRALASIVTEFGPISPLQVPTVASSEVRKLSGRHSAWSPYWAMGGWVLAGLTLATLGIAMLTGDTWSRLTGKNIADNDAQNAVKVELLDGNNVPEDATSRFPSVLLEGNPGTVWSVDFSPDGSSIAASIEDGSVRFWNIDKQEVVKAFNAHRGVAWAIRFHPTLDLFATSGDDATVKLWDSKTFDLKQEWRAGDSVRGIAFSPDGESLIAGDRDGKLHVYNLQTGKETATHSQSGAILGLGFSADGKSVASVGSDKIVRVFDTDTFELRQSFSGHEGPIYNVAFAPKGPLMATVGWNKDIFVWNVETGAKVMQLEGAAGDNCCVEFCSLGENLVTGGQDGSARLWDLKDGSMTATLHGHSSTVHNVALDPAKHRIATSSRDGTIRVWDMSALEDRAK